ncbi:FAD-binding protein [Shigella flexneri]
MIEIREGRGCDGPWGPHAKLKLDHLGKEVLESRLPGILELSRTFAHVDPVKEPIPVIPTCPLYDGRYPDQSDRPGCGVNEQGEDVLVPGLFAVGEMPVYLFTAQTASAVTRCLTWWSSAVQPVCICKSLFWSRAQCAMPVNRMLKRRWRV